MTIKKEKKAKDSEVTENTEVEMLQISSKADLKTFLTSVRDGLLKDEAAPIFAMAAMKHVLTHDEIYEFIDTSSKEILQEIWVKLSQSGFHLRKPPMLFTDIETAASNGK